MKQIKTPNERMVTKMENHPTSELMEKTLHKMREMIDANAIIGDSITTADGMTLIPVSKVSYGFAGGGSDFKQNPQKGGFGGGVGAGVSITPIAFIVAKGDSVELLYVTPPELTTADRIIETVPTVLDKVSEFFSKDKNETE